MKHMDPYKLIVHLAKQRLVRKPVRAIGVNYMAKYVGVAGAIGVNYMAKYVGVAVADVDTAHIESCCVLEAKDSNILAQSFQHLIRKESVEGIVVGLPIKPFAKNPRKNRDAIDVGKFVKDLSKTGKLNDVPYTLWDDSRTTSELMECLLFPLGLDPVIKKEVIDKACTRGATQVLQDYLLKMPRTGGQSKRNIGDSTAYLLIDLRLRKKKKDPYGGKARKDFGADTCRFIL